MDKHAIIFHGTDCTPTDYWYRWLAEQLKARGYKVEIPHYPEINHEAIRPFLSKVFVSHTFTENTVLIGHSAGSPLLLSILENCEVVIPKAILVAGYAHRMQDEIQDAILQDGYNWEAIKSHVKDIVFINSVNDPWGCNAEQGRYMFDRLGGTQIIKNEGHFGSDAYKQPYPEFDLLNKLID